jgi:hypothetical protein
VWSDQFCVFKLGCSSLCVQVGAVCEFLVSIFRWSKPPHHVKVNPLGEDAVYNSLFLFYFVIPFFFIERYSIISHCHHSCSRRQLLVCNLGNGPTSSMKGMGSSMWNLLLPFDHSRHQDGFMGSSMGSSMWNIRLIKKALSPQDYEIHLRSPTPCLPSKPVSEINEYTVR